MSDDELIHAEDESSPRRWRTALISGLFLLTIAGTGATDALWPAPAVTLLGQELREAERARKNRRIDDGSAARWVESRLSLRSRVRRTVAPWWTAALVHYGSVGSADVVVGDDHWLFLRTRVTPPALDDLELLSPGVNAIRAIERRLSAVGTDLLAVPLPRKAVACGALLPSGLDPRPELDRATIDMLRAGGLEVVDLLRAWEPLDPRTVYLAQDSHWALDGQLAAARACLDARPDLAQGLFEAELVRKQRARAVTGNLSFAGVLHKHPAQRWVAAAPDDIVVLEPSALMQRFSELTDPVEVAVVGSSFSANYNFPMLLFALAGRDIANRSNAAMPLAETLAKLVSTAPGGVLPGVIVYEFPMHQLWDLPTKRPGAMAGVGNTFLHLPHVEQAPLPGLLPFACRVLEADPRGLLAHGARGAIVTSGSGIVSVEFVGPALQGRRLRYRCDAFHFEFTWPKGRERVLFPIVEGAASDGFFELIALGGGPADVTATLVVDLDLARARTLAPADASGRIFDGAGETLEPRSAAVIRLVRGPVQRAPAEIVITFEGDAKPLTEAFEVFPGATFVIDLAGHAGERLAAVEVRTPWAVDAVEIAAR